MTHATAHKISLQTTARRALSAVCVMMAIGVATSAADRAAVAKSRPSATVSIESATPLAASELLHDITTDNSNNDSPPVNGEKAGTEREPSPPTASLAKMSFTTGRNARTVWMEVTAYCPCPKCCGPKASGVTASGRKVTHNAGKFVAADNNLPFGTRLAIPGYNDGRPVEVLDRGGAIKGKKLDLFYPTHEQALQWGRKWVAVTIYE
jgi:3D (Asp-Asp-Asp) domain-containing protein